MQMSGGGLSIADLLIVDSAIGADVTGGTTSDFLNGRIQTLALFDQTLTSAAMSAAASFVFSDAGCSIPHGADRSHSICMSSVSLMCALQPHIIASSPHEAVILHAVHCHHGPMANMATHTSVCNSVSL